ncbi:hypothetical protein BJX76DRAFT_61530 [Aspergillus varians]
MRSLFGFLTTLAAITVGTTALDASVITFGSETQRQGLSSAISSATLQRLLELRSESSTTSTLEGSDEERIELLGKLAGSPNRLFGVPVADGALDTITVILEGLSDNAESSIRNEYQSELVTSTFATGPARDDFITYLLETRPDGIVSPESKHCTFYSHENIDSKSQKDLAKPCLLQNSDSQIFSRSFNNELLSQAIMGESWINDRKGTAVVHITFEAKAASTYVNSLKSLFSDLHSLSLNGKRATAVVLSNANTTRRSSYSRRTPEVTKIGPSVNTVRDTQSMAFDQRGNAPLSLTPVCYASNSSCNEATNTCSGHGACYGKSGDCYACRCYETSIKMESGAVRKVRWGGSACQKKDISSPFFLIMGVTIAIMVAIGAAVGMTFSIGNTELPGVISAGVGAARAQK